MLYVHYGRENLDKDKFIYDNVEGKTLIVVPDQFTLQAERDAFFYMEVDGMMDVEVMSFSKLGDMVLQKQGGGHQTMIDRQGRQMLLAKILREEEKELSILQGYSESASFIEMVNDFISEAKQNGLTPEAIGQIAQELNAERLLQEKLKDVQRIFEKYEAQISGKYVDTEDYVNIYTEKIGDCSYIQERNIWIYGFEYFTPKNLQVVGELLVAAKAVHLVLTYDEGCRDEDLFALGKAMIGMLKRRSDMAGIETAIMPIDLGYLRNVAPASAGLEKELFSFPSKKLTDREGITLVRCANYYSEAKSAAAKILELTRDESAKLRDILVICNDMETRGSIYRRVFAAYGIDVFTDERRPIVNHPSVTFLLSLMDIITKGYRREDVLTYMKTGFSQIERGDIEDIENYSDDYFISGKGWKSDFTKGEEIYGEAILEWINENRKKVIDPIVALGETLKKGKTVREKTFALYEFMEKQAFMAEKLENLMVQQEEGGSLDIGAETAQIWDNLINVIEQLVAVVGDERISVEKFALMFKAGLEIVDIGILPPSVDGLLMGTMQRTRSGRVKTVMILGANDGVLPSGAAEKGILSDEERRVLIGAGMDVASLDALRTQEENLAIYKCLSKAEDEIWISYSASDEEGGNILPSGIFKRIEEIFQLPVMDDVEKLEDVAALSGSVNVAVQHLGMALRRAVSGQPLPEDYKEVARWLRENRRDEYDKLMDGLKFRNIVKPLSGESARTLYGRGLSDENQNPLAFSPSRLEKFGRCPFSHFVKYGLRPEERRKYAMEPVDMGDIYHRVLMKLSQRLTEGAPGWEDVTEDECRNMVADILNEEALSYREGLMMKSNEEEYRRNRMIELCSASAWAVIDQVRCGNILSMGYEVTFGKENKELPPIEVETEAGTVLIEGIIDRVDQLPGDYVKVIDYKSGNDGYSEKEVLAGWKLQLFIYLKAASAMGKKPAAMFYFHIGEPGFDGKGIAVDAIRSKLGSQLRRTFRMDGMMKEDPEVIRAIDGEIQGYSQVAPIRGSRDGIVGTTREKVLDEKAFEELMEKVAEKIDCMCDEIMSGKIDIHPGMAGTISGCTYCNYKGICKFDTSFEDCRFDRIRN